VAAFLTLVVVGLLLAAVAMVAPLPRYRYPVEPLLGLLAAGGLTTLVALARRALGLRGLPKGPARSAAAGPVAAATGTAATAEQAR
jgi:hypothetical protein